MERSLDFKADLKAFQESATGSGYELRLDLADIIVTTLNRSGMTQKQLADKAGVKPSFVTRIIHGAANCTFDSAGNILHALGVKAKFSVSGAGATGEPRVEDVGGRVAFTKDVRHGKEFKVGGGETYTEPVYVGDARQGRGHTTGIRRRA